MVASTLTNNQNFKMSLWYFFDKWALIGYGGVILNVVSLLEDANLPDVTGFSGLLIVGVAVYQKIRQDRRLQEKHNMQIEIFKKYLDGEIQLRDEIVAHFMDNPAK